MRFLLKYNSNVWNCVDLGPIFKSKHYQLERYFDIKFKEREPIKIETQAKSGIAPNIYRFPYFHLKWGMEGA